MTPPVSRAQVRAMLEAHASRHAQAGLDGRGNAVKLDIDDELNDAYCFILERCGHLAAEQFKRMYVEEELAFMLDLQANPQAVRRRILPHQAQSVTAQSQLPGPKKTGAVPFVATIAVLFAVGLLLGLSRH